MRCPLGFDQSDNRTILPWYHVAIAHTNFFWVFSSGSAAGFLLLGAMDELLRSAEQVASSPLSVPHRGSLNARDPNSGHQHFPATINGFLSPSPLYSPYAPSPPSFLVSLSSLASPSFSLMCLFSLGFLYSLFHRISLLSFGSDDFPFLGDWGEWVGGQFIS